MNEVLSICVKLITALIIGAVIGWERASKRHAAGLRTFVAVTLGCTVVTTLEIKLADTFSLGLPIMSAAAIIAVSSLCVNSILFNSKGEIKGLTTAASLWLCGIIGIVIGTGNYVIAVLSAVVLYITISFMPTVENYLKDKSNYFEVFLELNSSMYLKDFTATVRELGMRIDGIELNAAYTGSGLSVYMIELSIKSPELKKYKTHKEIIEALDSLEYVSHIEEMK